MNSKVEMMTENKLGCGPEQWTLGAGERIVNLFVICTQNLSLNELLNVKAFGHDKSLLAAI